MPYWGWIILGTVLLGTELAAVDAGFYLVFIGASAIAVGLLNLGGLAISEPAQWLLFAVLAVASMVLFRRRVYLKLRGGAPGFDDGPAGQTLRLTEGLAPGAAARLDFRGTSWTVLNDSDKPMSAGAQVRIASVDGLTLKVEPTPTNGE